MAKPKRYSPEQITRILKQQEAGLKVTEICRQASVNRPFTAGNPSTVAWVRPKSNV